MKLNQITEYYIKTKTMLKLKRFSMVKNVHSKYLCEAEDHSLSTSHLSDPLRFWADRENIYDKLLLVAQDIISARATASQAYVERVFSVCGMITAGRRNRMTKSLEMRAYLKRNRKVLAVTGFYMRGAR